jgi:hypothetical protein
MITYYKIEKWRMLFYTGTSMIFAGLFFILLASQDIITRLAYALLSISLFLTGAMILAEGWNADKPIKDDY